MHSRYFVLQKRRGHGESRGFGSMLVGTYDSVMNTKPAPYRILHQTPSSEVSYGRSNISDSSALSVPVPRVYFVCPAIGDRESSGFDSHLWEYANISFIYGSLGAYVNMERSWLQKLRRLDRSFCYSIYIILRKEGNWRSRVLENQAFSSQHPQGAEMRVILKFSKKFLN